MLVEVSKDYLCVCVPMVFPFSDRQLKSRKLEILKIVSNPFKRGVIFLNPNLPSNSEKAKCMGSLLPKLKKMLKTQ